MSEVSTNFIQSYTKIHLYASMQYDNVLASNLKTYLEYRKELSKKYIECDDDNYQQKDTIKVHIDFANENIKLLLGI